MHSVALKSARPYSIFLLLAYLFSTLSTAIGQDTDQPKIDLLQITPQIEAAASKAMQGCQPQEGKIIGEINRNGIYTLTGDLFKNRRIYAIIDDNQDVIICEWQKLAWKVVFAIDVHTVWNFPSGYREPIVERSSDDQPYPFWMLNLQDHPLLAIASEVEKEGQNYYVILFDSKCENILDEAYSFGLSPVVKNQYLLTGNSTRVKGDWQATYFSRIENDQFVTKKSWEAAGMYWTDHASNFASSNGRGYVILGDNRHIEHPADYLIFRCDPSASNSVIDLIDKTRGKPFAAIYFTPNSDFDGEESLAYLFEKLTGLPRQLFPDYDRFQMARQSEPKWKIKVRGSDEAIIKLLSPNPGN